MVNIGTEVVCVKQHSRQIIEIGKTYIVSDIESCSCQKNYVSYDVGVLIPPYNKTICTLCGHKFRSVMFDASLFAEIDKFKHKQIKELLATLPDLSQVELIEL